MRLRYKILASVLLQLLLFAFVPPLLTYAGLRAANWVRVWEYISDHEFFSSTSQNRVVLLGASGLGTRYCQESPDVPNAPVDDDCALRSVLQIETKKFPDLQKFSFFDFTTNGTLAEAHLYYLLLMLTHGGPSIKYLIYTLPGKLTLTLHERSYLVLNQEVSELIDALPPELHTEKLRWLSANYHTRLDAFAKEQRFFKARDRYRRFREIFWAHRSFVQDLLGDLKDRFAPDSSEVRFNMYLQKELAANSNIAGDTFASPIEAVEPESFFETDRDFLFLDILVELCERMGITPIFYRPASRTICPASHPEPCDSKIYTPIIERYRGRNVIFVDQSRDPYLVPRDSPDGVHPSLLKKVSLAKELLHVIHDLEAKKAR